MALTAAQKDELNALETQRRTLAARLEDERANAGDAATALGASGGDTSYARQDVSATDQHARAREEEVRRAEDERAAYERQIADLQRQLDVSGRNVSAAFDLARFLKWEYARNLIGDAERAAIEAAYESENGWGECLRVIHAAILRSESAFLDIPIRGASTDFNRPQYLKPGEPRQDASQEHFAQAVAQQRDRDAQLGRLREMKKDSYPADKISKAEADKRNADAELEKARTAQADKEASERALREASTVQREKFSSVRDELMKIERRMQELQSLAT